MENNRSPPASLVEVNVETFNNMNIRESLWSDPLRGVLILYQQPWPLLRVVFLILQTHDKLSCPG